MATENERLRQDVHKLSALVISSNASNVTYDVTLVTQQNHTIKDLKKIAQTHTKELALMHERCRSVEEENHLLIGRVLNQSTMINEVLLRINTIGRDQETQKQELEQVKNEFTLLKTAKINAAMMSIGNRDPGDASLSEKLGAVILKSLLDGIDANSEPKVLDTIQKILFSAGGVPSTNKNAEGKLVIPLNERKGDNPLNDSKGKNYFKESKGNNPLKKNKENNPSNESVSKEAARKEGSIDTQPQNQNLPEVLSISNTIHKEKAVHESSSSIPHLVSLEQNVKRMEPAKNDILQNEVFPQQTVITKTDIDNHNELNTQVKISKPSSNIEFPTVPIYTKSTYLGNKGKYFCF